MKRLIILFLFAIPISIDAKADCKASAFSEPDDIFRQKFNCDNGESYTYKRNEVFGETITNNQTGEKLKPSALSDIGDEYDSLGGRRFGDTRLERGVFGDYLKIDE